MLLQNCLSDMNKGFTENILRHITNYIKEWDFENTRNQKKTAVLDINGTSIIPMRCLALLKVGFSLML